MCTPDEVDKLLRERELDELGASSRAIGAFSMEDAEEGEFNSFCFLASFLLTCASDSS